MEIIVSVVNLPHSSFRFDNVTILCMNNKVGKDKGGGGRHRWCSKPFESDPPLHPFFLDHWMKAQLPALGWYPERKEIKSHILSYPFSPIVCHILCRLTKSLVLVVAVMVGFRFFLGAFFCEVAARLVTDPSPSKEVECTLSAFDRH